MIKYSVFIGISIIIELKYGISNTEKNRIIDFVTFLFHVTCNDLLEGRQIIK